MSTLKKAVKRYLQERRSLGFKLYKPGLLLHQFVDFLEQQGAVIVTKALALQWACLPFECQPSHWAKRLSVVRQFAQYYAAIDPRTEVPPVGLLPGRYQRAKPYIYTEMQIINLINATKELQSNTGLRACTYATFFGLVAITGMRISEAIGLDREDVDLNEGLLVVRKAKLDRSRVIPIHPSAVKVLRRYGRRRDQVHPQARTSSFFVSESGMRLTGCTVRWTFNRLSCQVGLRGPSDHYGPRIHDFRHTFAVRTVQEWYKRGKNVERLLPQLAMFLGHRHLNDTYWYLTATPELLHEAAKRISLFERRD